MFVPVIATDVNGLKQVVEGAGEIFHKGEESELAAKVNHILNDKDFYKEMSKKCKERAQLYDIHIMSSKYIEEYKRI